MDDRSKKRSPFKFSSEDRAQLSLASWGSTAKEKQELRNKALKDIERRKINARAKYGEK